jgi:hypothetical protein
MLFLQFIVLPHNYLLRNCYLQHVVWRRSLGWEFWLGRSPKCLAMDALVVVSHSSIQISWRLNLTGGKQSAACSLLKSTISCRVRTGEYSYSCKVPSMIALKFYPLIVRTVILRHSVMSTYRIYFRDHPRQALSQRRPRWSRKRFDHCATRCLDQWDSFIHRLVLFEVSKYCRVVGLADCRLLPEVLVRLHHESSRLPKMRVDKPYNPIRSPCHCPLRSGDKWLGFTCITAQGSYVGQNSTPHVRSLLWGNIVSIPTSLTMVVLDNAPDPRKRTIRRSVEASLS